MPTNNDNRQQKTTTVSRTPLIVRPNMAQGILAPRDKTHLTNSPQNAFWDPFRAMVRIGACHDPSVPQQRLEPLRGLILFRFLVLQRGTGQQVMWARFARVFNNNVHDRVVPT